MRCHAADNLTTRVKDNITSSGGSIKSDFELVKGFTFVYLFSDIGSH